MNYLAHALLAGDAPADRLGAMLGDFVKGPLPAGLPAAVAAGVALHRRIDSFADGHAVFQRSRARVSPLRRRYAGIMIDLFYDHFLAVHWHAYCNEPLPTFTAGVYDLLARHQPLLPTRLGRIFPAMRSQDWLGSYREIEAVGAALDGMARHRLRQPNRLSGAVEELHADYAGFEQDFRQFFSDVREFATRHRRAR